jgi:hypothetical protein
MILHIFNNQEKFSKGYFQFLKDYHIELNDHMLFHYGRENDYFVKLGVKTVFSSSFFSIIPNARLLCYLMQADKIIVHCLASPVLLMYLLMFKSLCVKTIWVLWGKDIYFYKTLRIKTPAHVLYEWLRKLVIPRIHHVAGVFREDFDVLKDTYGTTAIFHEINMIYPYEVSRVNVTEKKTVRDSRTIQIGNSGSTTNNHIDCFNRIKSCAANIEKIFTPLSYGGSKKYAEMVARKGKELFGDKYIPIFDFMPIDDYFNHAKMVDIVIFNHNRQEGAGNIFSFINMKKTVYMRSDIITWSFLKRNGILVKDVYDIEKNGLTQLTEDELEQNYINLQKIIDFDASINAWKRVFNMSFS